MYTHLKTKLQIPWSKTELKGEIDKSTINFGDFDAPFSKINRTSRQQQKQTNKKKKQ